jgi:type II secretory pathway predicted ATPase ExeA
MLARKILTKQAQRAFKLKRDPFDVNRLPSEGELFTDQALDNIALQIKDAVLNRKFIGVIGEIGSGKTLMKKRVHAELNNSVHTVRLIYPDFFNTKDLTVSGIVSELLLQLGQSVPHELARRARLVKASLLDRLIKSEPVALVFDEAHNLNDSVISSLKKFWELDDGAFARLLGIILYGQPSFVQNRLRQVKFSEINQRLQIINMPNFRHSAQEYLGHRIQLAGGEINKLFDSRALQVLCENAGSPLELGNLANLALNQASAIDEPVTCNLPIFEKLNIRGVIAKPDMTLVKSTTGGNGNGKI